MADYILRKVDKALWHRVKARAATDGQPLHEDDGYARALRQVAVSCLNDQDRYQNARIK